MKKSHPGKLIEANLDALSLSVVDAAKAMQVTREQLSNVMRGTSAISPDMALRLAKVMGGSADFWLRLQATSGLTHARNKGIPGTTGSNQRKIKCEWGVDEAVFNFSSLKEANAFEKNPVFSFEFNPDNADDCGKSVLAKLDSAQNFRLNKKNSEVSLFRKGKNILVDASVTFEVPVKRGVTLDKFDKWVANLAGDFCGSIATVDIDAGISIDSGTYLRAVRFPGHSVRGIRRIRMTRVQRRR